MKTSGNNTPAIQRVYIMWNVPYVHKVKIGISGGVAYRRKMISDSTPGVVFPIFLIKIPFAYAAEQFMHRLFRVAHSPFSSGSGHTEWFNFLVAPFAILIMVVFQLMYWGALLLIALFLCWLISGCPKL